MIEQPIFSIKTNGAANTEYKNIETEFLAPIPANTKIHYLSLEGTEPYNEIKNQVIEDYVDGTPRVYLPETPLFKEREITLTLLFIGDQYRKSYAKFTNLLQNKKWDYKDTGRNIEISKMILKTSNIMEESVMLVNRENTPYLKAEFKFLVLDGIISQIQ